MLFRFEFLFHFSKAFTFCKYCRTAPWCESSYFSLKFANNVKRIYFCSFCFELNYLKEKDMLPKKIYHILESSWSWKKERVTLFQSFVEDSIKATLQFFLEKRNLEGQSSIVGGQTEMGLHLDNVQQDLRLLWLDKSPPGNHGYLLEKHHSLEKLCCDTSKIGGMQDIES